MFMPRVNLRSSFVYCRVSLRFDIFVSLCPFVISLYIGLRIRDCDLCFSSFFRRTVLTAILVVVAGKSLDATDCA